MFLLVVTKVSALGNEEVEEKCTLEFDGRAFAPGVSETDAEFVTGTVFSRGISISSSSF